LSLLACDDDSSSNGLMPYLSLSGLTPGQTIYIRFWEYGNDNNGTFGICATSPTCATPSLNPTTNITTTTATISWNAVTPTPINGYQYFVSTSNTTPSSGTTTVSTSVNLTGLSIDSIYYVFVRSDCGGGDFSSWSPYGVFYTGYCPSTSSSSSYYINNFSTNGGYSNINNNGSGYSAGGYGNFTTQSVSQINSGSVSFSASFYDGLYSYGFNIWVDWNDDFDFNDIGELVYASGSYVTSASGTFSVPASASIGNHRMRIVADYLSTNPSSCGSISYGETEDYTFTVTNPLPCSGNPTNISVSPTTQTSATATWTAASPIPANGYQYYLSTSNTSPNPSTIPTGNVSAGVTTLNLTGLISGTTYYIWIRSNCGGALGQGVWIGPINFNQPNCTLGNSSGTSALGCPNVLAGGLGLNGSDPAPLTCASTGCTDLEATYLHLGQTTNYTVQSIPYNPPYQFGCLKNPISINVDDVWSPTVNLPFNFCFYGNNYNQCLIGSNGVLTFDTTNNSPGGYCQWSFSSNLPSTSLFENTIFGVYHDIDPSVGITGEVGWELITLNSGCRALVASWNNIPMFSSSCNSINYTGMIVLYENTNIIEVYIKEKNVCSSWNSGNAIVGIQNSSGTLASVPPSRNGLDPDWTVTNEAWRFVPSGASITTLKWHEGSGISGPVIGTSNTLNVCPTATTTYTAEVTYTLCNGNTLTETDETTVTVSSNKVWNGSINSNWNVAANWTPSGTPTNTHAIIIPPTLNNPIISGSGYNGLACSLTILNGASLTINSNSNATITNWINVQPSGLLIVENNANLVQINNASINTGNISYQRNANIRKLDYVYWSSPVANFNINNISSPIAPGPIYKWDATYVNPNGGQGYWLNAVGNTMIKGKGYIVRGPSSFSSTIPSTLNGVFTGIPNNGIITIPISRGTDTNTSYHTGANGTEITNFSDNWNLVGNPYPSSIRGSQFLFNNNTKIEGSINLWTHGTLPAVISSPFYDTFVYNYTPGDYLTYNFTGTTCCPAAGSDLFIGAGQGFFVQMKDGPTATDFVTFDNGLRSASYDNSLFYRTSNPTTSVNQNLVDIERHRIWLDIIDANYSSNRTLFGYIEGATMDRDSFFDSKIAAGGFMSIYSLIEGNKYNIQGRALPFNLNDEVPIGVNITTAGTYSIAIAGIDGLFNIQNIYLIDTFLNVIHDIKANPYQFTSDEGTFNQRFKIVYLPFTLNNNNFSINNDIKVLSNTNIEIISSIENIKSIIVFDVLGRKIDEFKNINSQNFIISTLMKNNTTLFLNVTLEDNSIVIKKIIH
jgi:hypothetical protein